MIAHQRREPRAQELLGYHQGTAKKERGIDQVVVAWSVRGVKLSVESRFA